MSRWLLWSHRSLCLFALKGLTFLLQGLETLPLCVNISLLLQFFFKFLVCGSRLLEHLEILRAKHFVLIALRWPKFKLSSPLRVRGEELPLIEQEAEAKIQFLLLRNWWGWFFSVFGIWKGLRMQFWCRCRFFPLQKICPFEQWKRDRGQNCQTYNTKLKRAHYSKTRFWRKVFGWDQCGVFWGVPLAIFQPLAKEWCEGKDWQIFAHIPLFSRKWSFISGNMNRRALWGVFLYFFPFLLCFCFQANLLVFQRFCLLRKLWKPALRVWLALAASTVFLRYRVAFAILLKSFFPALWVRQPTPPNASFQPLLDAVGLPFPPFLAILWAASPPLTYAPSPPTIWASNFLFPTPLFLVLVINFRFLTFLLLVFEVLELLFLLPLAFFVLGGCFALQFKRPFWFSGTYPVCQKKLYRFH